MTKRTAKMWAKKLSGAPKGVICDLSLWLCPCDEPMDHEQAGTDAAAWFRELADALEEK